MIGERVGHYQLVSKIGSGGMGEVYLATDLELQRNVAVKFLSPERARDEESRRRFIHEAKAQAMLSHPNIATFHEVGEYKGRPFIVMEYVEGETLPRLVDTEKLSLSDILELAIQIAEGLQAAHDHSVVHRDIKPQNVMVTPDRRIKLTDFGLARWKGATTLTKTGTRLGTAYYMSPEQAEGKRVDHRTDIFSFGVILYELICRQRPFEGDSEATILYDLLHSQPPPLARFWRNAPDNLERVVSKCLAKAPEDRYQSAADLATDLRAVQRDISGSGPPLPMHRRRRGISRAATMTVAGLAVGVILILSISSLREGIKGLFRDDSFPDGKHLAVIPFADIGGDSGDRAFNEGLIETLTSKLSQLEQFQGALWVIPASEIREVDVTSARDARKAFGVNLAVTGSVQQLDDRARVIVNLVDAKTERQIRSMTIDDYASNVSALQDSVVFELASMLEVELVPEERDYLAAGGTTEAEAYELYLRGHGYVQRAEKAEQLDSAIALFRQAIDKDPDYARGLAGLADAVWQKYRATDQPDLIAEAVEYCNRALEIDERLAEPHVTLGLVYRGTGRYEKAVDEFQQALALNPLNHEGHLGLARTYEALNEFEKAESTYKRVIELRPDYWTGYRYLQFFYLMHGRHDDARRYLDKVVALNPEGFTSWNNLGAVYWQLDLPAKAEAMWERSIAIEPNYGALSNLGTLHYMNGHFAQAAQMYEQAIDIDDHDYRVWINLASAYHWTAGKEEEARTTYRQAIRMAETQRAVNPRDANLLADLAGCYATIDEADSAVTHIERALELAPQDVGIMVDAALVYAQVGQADAAVERLGTAVAMGYPAKYIRALPEFAVLREDSRFRALVSQDSSGAVPDTS